MHVLENDPSSYGLAPRHLGSAPLYIVAPSPLPSPDYGPDTKPSVFDEVLRPRQTTPSGRRHGDTGKKAIQVEIHVTLSPTTIKASILLNKLRLIGIFDLILELKRFVFDKLPEEDGKQATPAHNIGVYPSHTHSQYGRKPHPLTTWVYTSGHTHSQYRRKPHPLTIWAYTP